MIFPLCKWYFDINWHKFVKRWADVFQIYPNAIHLNPLQFCSSMPLLDFPLFCLSSSIVLNRYFHILVNSMTIWSVLKLLKIAWPSPLSHPCSFMVYYLFGVFYLWKPIIFRFPVILKCPFGQKGFWGFGISVTSINVFNEKKIRSFLP